MYLRQPEHPRLVRLVAPSPGPQLCQACHMGRLSRFRAQADGVPRYVLIFLATVAICLLAARGGSPALPAVSHPATLLRYSDSGPVMSTTVPGAPDCPMFPASNIWNTNISKLP